jgi:hypothetical protein
VSSEFGNTLNFVTPPFGNFANIFAPFPLTPAQIAPVPIPSNGTLLNLNVYNPHLELPYTLEWNFALEQAMGRHQTISASYVGAAGRRLLQTTTVAAPPTSPSTQSGQLIDNTSSSDYDALQLQFQRRLSQRLQVLASYTWSHSIDDASAGSVGNRSNVGIPGAGDPNRGPSDFDVRHAFTAGLTYDIPAPHMNSFSDVMVRGWSIQSLVFARSAPPVDLTDPLFSKFDTGFSAAIRPDVVAGQPFYLYGSQYPGGKAFNPQAFTDPPSSATPRIPARQGTLARNSLRGFGATQWDLGIHRDFPVRELFKLQFRAEMFNVLNHPNFAPPNNQFGRVGFGLSAQTLAQSLSGSNLGGGGLSPLYQIGGPRSIQLALKLIF